MSYVRPRTKSASVIAAIWTFLIVAALALSSVAIVPRAQADPVVLQPDEMTLDIAKAGSSAALSDSELQAGMGMREYSGGQVIINLVPSLGETAPRQYRVTLPEFYSFSGLSRLRIQ